jgi:hypothetical protein
LIKGNIYPVSVTEAFAVPWLWIPSIQLRS